MLKAYFHILPLVYAIVKVYTMQKCHTFVQNYGQSTLSRWHNIVHGILHNIVRDIVHNILHDIMRKNISIKHNLQNA